MSRRRDRHNPLTLDRTKDVERFYELLRELEGRVDGKRTLNNCHWNLGWPDRGVYFFFEEGETRARSPNDLRVVRVGTHAVTAKSKSRLWHRLYEHKQDGGRSVFRDHVNRSLRERAATKGRHQEHNHTRCTSAYIGRMPFLWLNVDGVESYRRRTWLERNAIALLSGWRNQDIDRPSDDWLGRYSAKTEIRKSGLWNVQHIKGEYKSSFLEYFADYVGQTSKLNDPADDWDSPICIGEDAK